MAADRATVADFGRLFVMAFDGVRPDREALEFFTRFRIGGLILFEDNYEHPAQLRELIAGLQARCAADGEPVLMLTDHEGGRVQRFRAGFSELPAAADLGLAGVEATAEAYARAGRELREAGVNLVLAPVADVCPRDRPGTIGDRAFGDTPEVVAEHVDAAVRALQDAGVAACAKHFPGHGPTEDDGHRVLPVVERDEDELAARDLLPFRAALDAGAATVMTAHAVYPASGDAERPASLSPYWIAEVLRGRLGFDGVVVSDALEMKGLMTQWTPVDSGLRALEAGTDLVLYYKEADQYAAFYELRLALERGDLDPAPVRDSLRRLAALRHRLKRP
jgi:beta-N-acetylhexosaminidase